MEKQKGDTDKCKLNIQRHRYRQKNREEIQTDANLTYRDKETDRKNRKEIQTDANLTYRDIETDRKKQKGDTDRCKPDVAILF